MDRNNGRNRRARAGYPAMVGFTMVELMAVVVILIVALLGFVMGLGTSVQEISASKQSYVAMNAARSKIEELKGYSFSDLYTDYGPASGNKSFDVSYGQEGKDLTLLDASGDPAGRITFFVDETAIPGTFGWTTTYDLNGDGDSTDMDVSGKYDILPVEVTVEWIDALGERETSVRAILFDPKYSD